jgi:hypothetical protein
MAIRIDEGFLSRVLSEMVVAKDRRGVGDTTILVQPDQLREGRLVAGLCAGHQPGHAVAIRDDSQPPIPNLPVLVSL